MRANPNLRAVQREFKLGEFPGRVSSNKGEEAPRLSSTLTLSIKDKMSGESFKRIIAFDCDGVDELLHWIEQVLSHKRVRNDIESFSSGRDGGPA